LIVLQRCSETGISLDEGGGFGQCRRLMEKSDESRKLSWPWWASWALLAVVATSVVTIAATLYDIL
jgi:hypothetical protein